MWLLSMTIEANMPGPIADPMLYSVRVRRLQQVGQDPCYRTGFGISEKQRRRTYVLYQMTEI